MASSFLGKKGFCPHKDEDYDGPSIFWCDDCAEIKDRIRDRNQRRYEIARDVMAACAVHPATMRVVPMAKAAVQCADALLAELERTDGE